METARRDSRVSGEQSMGGRETGERAGRHPSWLHFTQLSGTCHYLLYSSSPFITKYFSSFICCSCCFCCPLCWHPTEFASERGTSRRVGERKEAVAHSFGGNLLIYSYLTAWRKGLKRKKTKTSRRKSPYGKLCMLILIFRKTTTTTRRTTSITTPALLQLFFSLIWVDNYST